MGWSQNGFYCGAVQLASTGTERVVTKGKDQTIGGLVMLFSKQLAWLGLIVMGLAQHPQTTMDYDEARELALVLKKSVVVGVGCDVPSGDWLVVKVNAPWNGYRRGLVVSRVENGELFYVGELPVRSSELAVKELLKRPLPTYSNRRRAEVFVQRVQGQNC